MGTCSSSGKGGGTSTKKGETSLKSMLSESELKLITPIPEAERKDYYYSLRSNELDYLLNQANNPDSLKNLQNAIKSDIVVVNEDLPELTGSAKQIAWAKKIREYQITQQINRYLERISDPRRLEFLEQAKEKDKNVKTFSDAINYALNFDKKKAFAYFKTATSAGEIIDKYKGY